MASKQLKFKKWGLLILTAIVLGLLAAACAGAAQPETITKVETVIVEKEVEKEVEKIVTVEVEKEVEKVVTVEVEKVVEVTPEPGERILTIGMNELVTSLDPPTDWAIAATWIHLNIFDCLIWRNRQTAARSRRATPHGVSTREKACKPCENHRLPSGPCVMEFTN